MTLPLSAVALVVVVGAITALRWWRPVLRERRRASRWLWLVSLAIAATALAVADYSRLAEAGQAMSAGLALGTLLVASSEELMFRGVTLHSCVRDTSRQSPSS